MFIKLNCTTVCLLNCAMTGSWNMQYANKCNETHLSQDRKGKKKTHKFVWLNVLLFIKWMYIYYIIYKKKPRYSKTKTNLNVKRILFMRSLIRILLFYNIPVIQYTVITVFEQDYPYFSTQRTQHYGILTKINKLFEYFQ